MGVEVKQENLESNKLIRVKFQTSKDDEAGVSSVSPSSERMIRVTLESRNISFVIFFSGYLTFTNTFLIPNCVASCNLSSNG